MPTVLDPEETSLITCPHDSMMSVGGEHELTRMAAIEPPAYPVREKAAPMERYGVPEGQFGNECKMMSRCPQHADGFEGVQAALVVDEPLQPSSYIQ